MGALNNGKMAAYTDITLQHQTAFLTTSVKVQNLFVKCESIRNIGGLGTAMLLANHTVAKIRPFAPI